VRSPANNHTPHMLMHWLSNMPLFLSKRCKDTLLRAAMGLYVLASPQHWQRRQRMGPHSTSEQEPRARLSLRDARFADWQFSSEGHMVARPGGTLAGRLRTPFKARVRPRKAVALPLGSQSPGTCL